MLSRDPVCGAHVSTADAYAVEGYGPLVYNFCSQDCHQRFLANPNDYVSHDPGDAQHAFTTEDQPDMPQQWRDEGDFEGPPTKR